jgi:filamentous hemagglutinin family protein
MNALCYKIVFSKRLGALVAVGEHTAGQGKAAGTGVRTAVCPSYAVGATAGEFVGSLKAVFASVALTCFTATTIAAGPAANTLPTGAQVTTGNVAISTNGATMNILQSTDKASVNWNSFSIGSGAAVNVQQNSASSVLLNRVVGNDPSQIFGKLTANGQVILINPNGVVFGKGGSVTASSFTASTFGMTEEDFKKGKHKFTRNGSTAGVTVEEGATINTTIPGGYVALIGSTVNNQGKISTQGGAVVLAAGESVAMPAALTDSVGVPLSSKVRLELAPSTINASVENGGTITTEGGQVLMQAAAVVDAVSHVANASVTNTGTIDTTGEQGGRVDLLANHGTVRVSGTVKANSTNGTAGGSVFIGRDEDTNTLAAIGDASGARIESKGGFVETSGEFIKVDGARVLAKDWLLDPFNITIVDNNGSTTAGATSLPSYTPSATSTIKASDIAGALTNGTSVTISTAGSGSDFGDITVNSAITSAGTASLTLRADRNITVNAKIGAGDGAAGLNINLQAGQTTNTGGITIADNGSLDAKAGNIQLQTKGGNITSNATLTGKNISIDNTMGGIDPNTGAITPGTNAPTTSTHGVNLGSTSKLLASGNINIRGVTNATHQWGTRIGGELTAQSMNIKGIMTSSDAGNGGGLVITNGTQITTSMDSFVQAENLSIWSRGTTLLLGDSGASNISVKATNGSTLKLQGESKGNNVLGSSNVPTGLFTQGTVISSGNIELTGSSKSSHGLQSNADIQHNGGQLTLTGSSSPDGLVANFGAHGVLITNKITVSDNSNLTLKGEAIGRGSIPTNTSLFGVSMFANVTGNGGDLKVEGSSTLPTNVTNNAGGTLVNAAVSGWKDATIQGTAAGGGQGVGGTGSISATNNINITGTAVNGVGINRINGGVTSSDGNITMTGTSDNNRGVILNNNLTANKGKLTLTGESKVSGQGLRLEGNSAISADHYEIKGIAKSGQGINQDGVASFKSTSTTNDSRIEGTGGAGNIGVSIFRGALTLDSGNGKTTMRSGESSSGGINLGSVEAPLITTKGDVTIGSKHGNALLAIQASNIEATGKLTLMGKSSGNGITMQDGGGNPVEVNGATNTKIVLDGESSGSGAGMLLRNVGNVSHIITAKGAEGSVTLLGKSVSWHGINTDLAKITASDGASISMTGTSTSASGSGSGVVVANAIKTTGGGNITIQGESFGSGSAVILNTNGGAGLIDASGAASITGTANGTGNVLGINSSLEVKGKSLTLDGTTKGSGQGIFTSGKLSTTDGNLKVTGISNTGNGVQTQGLIEATGGDVTIKGTTDGAGAYGVIAQNSVKATGNIEVEGKTKSTDNNVYGVGLTALNNNANSPTGSLTTTGTNKNVTIKTNTLLVNAAIDAGSTGSVVIQTTDANMIHLGAADVANADRSKQILGISQAELAKITANKLIIGSSTDGGSINVASAIDVNHIDTLSLQTKTDKTITQTITGTNSGSIAAKNVEIDSGNVTLNNANNNITTLAAKAASLNFVNKEALVIGNVNGRSGIKTTGGVSVITRTGDLTIDESILNSGNDAVVLGAGISKSAGDKTGGDIKTRSGAFVTNDDGMTFIYTGSTQNTGLLTNLHSDFSELRLSGDSTDANNNALAQNAESNVAFETNNARNTITKGGKAQVLFREAISLDTSSINSTNLDRIYGDDNTAKSASAGLLAAMRTQLKQANPGQFITRLANNDNGVNTFKVSKAALIDAMTSTLNVSDTDQTSDFSTSKFLKANADGTSYSYGQWSSNKFTATIDSGKATVSVKQRALIGSISAGNTVYGESLQLGDVSFTNKVGSDNLVALKRITVTGKTSTSGNLEAGTHTGIQHVHSLSGNDAGNYTFENVKGDYTVTQRKLTATDIAAVSTEYGTPAAAGDATLNGVQSTNVGTDQVSAKTAINGTSLSGSNNINAGQYTQSVTGIEGKDAKNYEFTSFTTAGKTYIVTPKSLAATYLAKDKVFDGSTTADVIGTVTPISGDKVNVLHTRANFDSPDIGTAKTVTVSGITLLGADATNYKVDSTVNAGNTATTKASITAVPPKPPVPVVPTDGNSRVKVPVGSANPFALASAEDLADDTCSANSIENCYCEPSELNKQVDICYEPKAGAKGSAR